MDEPASSTTGCYWDVDACRWVRFERAPAATVVLPEPRAAEVAAAGAAPAG